MLLITMKLAPISNNQHAMLLVSPVCTFSGSLLFVFTFDGVISGFGLSCFPVFSEPSEPDPFLSDGTICFSKTPSLSLSSRIIILVSVASIWYTESAFAFFRSASCSFFTLDEPSSSYIFVLSFWTAHRSRYRKDCHAVSYHGLHRFLPLSIVQ